KFLVVNSFFHFGGPFLPARIGCEKENGRHRSEGKRERRCGKQLATSAIFADSLVHHSVKFRTRESDFVGSVLTVVASFGKLGTSSGRRSDVIAGSRGHQLSDFAGGKQLRFTGKPGSEGDFCKVLHDFNTKEGGKQIRTTGYRTVISQ